MQKASRFDWHDCFISFCDVVNIKDSQYITFQNLIFSGCLRSLGRFDRTILYIRLFLCHRKNYVIYTFQDSSFVRTVWRYQWDNRKRSIVDRQTDNTIDKRVNIDLQNTTQKSTDGATWTHTDNRAWTLVLRSIQSSHSHEWVDICSFTNLGWRHRDVCNLNMIYIEDIIPSCMNIISCNG